ncbi:protein NUCLEAR FUSION DEFECTIVE 4 [Prunus yedoensis var. nudiflora]|uniref:Protein NUCLEAR FUSION DEFECTIVE 4 n=1 Tax=Prunus yedoensis var. nudiflora TaxID=2094558 RepID=A0A314Z3S0_PRUYE|nr:protein NUCLEAR FUSION DEFECTIVE 4 [Prunus yedoensis var. nudiflora]
MKLAEFSFGGGGLGYKEIRSFDLQVLHGRWFMVFASMLILSWLEQHTCLASTHTDIKTSLGYDQTTVNLLSFFKDLGGNVGVIAGLVRVHSSLGGPVNRCGHELFRALHDMASSEVERQRPGCGRCVCTFA